LAKHSLLLVELVVQPSRAHRPAVLVRLLAVRVRPLVVVLPSLAHRLAVLVRLLAVRVRLLVVVLPSLAHPLLLPLLQRLQEVAQRSQVQVHPRLHPLVQLPLLGAVVHLRLAAQPSKLLVF
jgi:hypothetical protein